ncbi:MAG: DNA mismatch repair protein MutL, partial [Alicyclobacillus sp. RIFOXYA1_FULL_53_8]
LGHRLLLEGGTIKTIEHTAADRGTDIHVRDLFYNTPARLKYMKTIQTELGHISDYIYRIALAHDHISFSLKHNGHSLLQTIGNQDMLQVIASIYGSAVARKMVKLSTEHLDYSLHGYIAKPEITRANRSAISFYVNGRYIRSFVLNNALQQAYHTLLPINRFPIAVLNIQMDPSLVDVNVHPSKMEVRFSKEKELSEFVTGQLRQVLRAETLIPEGQSPWTSSDKNRSSAIQEQFVLYRSSAQEEMEKEPVNGELQQSSDGTPAPAPASVYAPQGGREAAGSSGYEQAKRMEHKEQVKRQDSFRPSTERGGYVPPKVKPDAEAVQAWLSALPKHSEASPKLAEFPQLEPVGQVHGTYIVAQNSDGLYLIDQHAAHERINFEYYYEQFGSPEPASQELLIPITLEFTSAESEQLNRKLSYFAQVGVELEPFGGSTFIVRSYPHWFPQGDEKELIEEMAEWLLTKNSAIDLAQFREKSSALCSCKASIKANQNLSLQAMEALLDKLASCKNPYTCPHGRPIVISFSTYELEKMFKRVM